ncbi:MAG TPA: GNAT family protein [Planctomycetota bacterium]|nr:GNAT family protein [Planctomycetota bacterium]
MDLSPAVLEGRHVRLEPLSLDHLPGLVAVGLDPELWRWMPIVVSTAEQMKELVETAIQDHQNNAALPFATIERSSGKVVGTTRLFNIEHTHRRVEIGWTWIARPWQRTAVNTEAKFLMLRHAFEKLGCIRVELKTDSLNERSRAAILRLGAKEEGTLRNHMIVSTGRIRHTIYFSILDSEWSVVKAGLEAKLAARL